MAAHWPRGERKQGTVGAMVEMGDARGRHGEQKQGTGGARRTAAGLG